MTTCGGWLATWLGAWVGNPGLRPGLPTYTHTQGLPWVDPGYTDYHRITHHTHPDLHIHTPPEVNSSSNLWEYHHSDTSLRITISLCIVGMYTVLQAKLQVTWPLWPWTSTPIWHMPQIEIPGTWPGLSR